MTTVTVRHQWHQGVLNDMASQGGSVYRDMARRALKVQTASRRRLRSDPRRIDTGNLWNSIHIEVVNRGGTPTWRIGTKVDYARYVHDGTMFMAPNPFLRDGLRAAAD